MKGEKILLATLLKWYFEHGLEVTRVYQVVEYTPKPCFKPFGEIRIRHGSNDMVEHAKYDKRMPGLFKLECEGNGL